MKKTLLFALILLLAAGICFAGGNKEKASGEKVWIVATDTVFRPFEYTNEKNEFVGIDVDILAAVAEDQGFKYDLQSLGWDAGIAAVQVGQADALIAGATIKPKAIALHKILCFNTARYAAVNSFNTVFDCFMMSSPFFFT